MSSYQHLGPILTLAADATVVGLNYRAVACASDGEWALASAGGRVNGILVDKAAAAGQGVSAQTYGVAEVDLGGTVTSGDKVKSDANGKAVAATAADVAAGLSFGTALEGGVDGGRAPILLNLAGNGVGGGGYLDTALATGALDTAYLYKHIYFSIDGTKSAALPSGLYVGQEIYLTCDLAANTPAGTITGTFLSQAAVSGTSLAFNAAADQAHLVWTGAAWRVVEALVSVTLT